MFVEMWGFRLLLLSSISVIISGFSFCLRRGIPAFAVKLQRPYYLQRSLCLRRGIPAFAVKLQRTYYLQRSLCLRRGTFVGRKYPKASAFLKESSQRTKNIFPCCPSPVSLSRRCSEFSMVVLPRLRRPACAFAPRTPCFILLAPFYQRIRLAGIRR